MSESNPWQASIATEFDAFWSVYPKRQGSNPRQPAEKIFVRLVKSGVRPEILIRAAMQFAQQEKKAIGTPYIPMATTWLNQQRFADMAIAEPAQPLVIDWDKRVQDFIKWGTWRTRDLGPDPECAGCRCPPDVLAKHGLST